MSDLPKSSGARAPFRLGAFAVFPASGELRGPRGTERLRPILMEVLLRLAAEPGQVVRRETLLNDAWPRRMVNDDVLSRAIAELRTVLDDDARDARYIETLPKLGYRLVAEVAALAAPPTQAPAPVARPPAGGRRALPVLAAGALVLAGAIATWQAAEPGRGGDRLVAALAAARPLTSDPAWELGPRFSPDGRRVAYALGRGTQSRIVVQAIDGSARRDIGGPGVLRLAPVFFPDGRRLAYWRGEERDCAIVEHDLESGRERALLDCALHPRSRFDLSADGRRIVFSAQPHPQYPAGLWLLDLGHGKPRALTSPRPGTGDDLYPRFSPDGRRLAWFRGNESHRQPWVMLVDDSESARAAGPHDGLSYGVAWLGVEGPLLVAADWFGFRALNVLDLATGHARLAGARGARFPDAGPNGELAWENAAYSANLWQLDLRGDGAAQVRWRSTRYTNQPEFSPDGGRVAFASNRDGNDALYVATLDGEARRIAFGAGHRYLRPHWSADGRSVLAVRITTPAQGPAVQEAVRIPVAGGGAVVLAALGRAVNDVRESHDGRWLYWGELAGHAMRLLRAPTADPTRSERLPLPEVATWQMNRDRLVYTQPQLDRLTSCRLRDFACAPMEPRVPEADQFHWSLGPHSVFLRTREGATATLVRLDLATGKEVQRLALAPSGAGTSIAASPDEAVLLVVREEGPEIDLMFARR